jgi:hypothetical protein
VAVGQDVVADGSAASWAFALAVAGLIGGLGDDDLDAAPT